MKSCVDTECPEINPQPLGNFYDHPSYADRKQQRCKTCCIAMIRRSRAQPVSTGDGYLARHLKRRERERELEATFCLSQHQPTQEGFYSASPSNWIGMVDRFLRPKAKESRWAIR